MNVRTGSYLAALLLGAAAFAGPASAQLKAIGAGAGTHLGGGAGGAVAAHPSFAGGAVAARPNFGSAGLTAQPNFSGAGFAAGKTGATPVITGRSVATPGAGMAAAAAGPKAGFAGRSGPYSESGFSRGLEKRPSQSLLAVCGRRGRSGTGLRRLWL